MALLGWEGSPLDLGKLGARIMTGRPVTAGRVVWLVSLMLLAACGGGSSGASSSHRITLYTCVDAVTVQPVVKQFEDTHPGTQVQVYRAATGDLNARVAADVRSGGLRADVIWACDPLTMKGYAEQDLVAAWTPSDASAIPRRYRTSDYVGAAVLYMVAIYHNGIPAPHSWADLADPRYAKAALPDPGFAASALGTLGYFSSAPGYGVSFYEHLRKGGAVQVSSPDEVTTGVAQGIYRAGITIASSAYAAKQAGSPVGVSWPEPGAIAVYGPIALAKRSAHAALAKEFITFVISKRGQQVLGKAGSYPALPGIAGPTVPAGAPVVFPDWAAIESHQNKLLNEYNKVFGS